MIAKIVQVNPMRTRHVIVKVSSSYLHDVSPRCSLTDKAAEVTTSPDSQ
jgi:hypothetical protein